MAHGDGGINLSPQTNQFQRVEMQLGKEAIQFHQDQEGKRQLILLAEE
jgi:hypothetical protein